MALALVSCGSDKKVDKDVEKEAVKNNYTAVIDAVYEQDDTIKAVYKLDGYWKEDGPVSVAVKGNPAAQKIEVAIPAGIELENIKFFLSTNKAQKTLKVNGISIFNNKKMVFNGDNNAYAPFFDANSGLSWDPANMRNNLNFSGPYPPGISGNDKMEIELVQ